MHMAPLYDDFYIQCMLFALVVIAALFLFDLLIDPFKLQDDCQIVKMSDTQKDKMTIV